MINKSLFLYNNSKTVNSKYQRKEKNLFFFFFFEEKREEKNLFSLPLTPNLLIKLILDSNVVVSKQRTQIQSKFQNKLMIPTNKEQSKR